MGKGKLKPLKNRLSDLFKWWRKNGGKPNSFDKYWQKLGKIHDDEEAWNRRKEVKDEKRN